MKIDAYGCYTIQSALGKPNKDGYLHIPGATLEKNKPITLWGLDTRGVEFTDHFEFALIPVPNTANTYYIVSRRSGLALIALPDRVVQGTPGEGIPNNPSDDALFEFAAQFVFEPTGDATFAISSQLLGTYLAAKDQKTANGTPLVSVPAIEAHETAKTHKEFRLTRVARLMGTIPAPVAKAGRRFPQLKNLHTELPLDTEPLLREIETVPFFAINDPVYPPYRQVAVSPYYTVSRSTLWSKVFDRQLDGIVERETVDTAETGLSQMAATSVRSTFSKSISTTAKAGYSGFGVSASVSVTGKLAMESERTSQMSTEARQAHMFTETILYPAVGKPYRLAKWRPVDRYELKRKDGSLVASWDAVRTEEEVIDVFPRSVGAPERKLPASETDRKVRAAARKELAAVG